MASAFTAGIATSVATNPIWLIKTRMKMLRERKELASTAVSKSGSKSAQLDWSDTFLAASSAKLLAAVVAYPHEVLRTRLRETPLSNGRPKYYGLWQSTRLIYAEEGFAGLYGGLTAHLMRVVPNAAILFATMSSEIAWEITRNSSSFLVKRNGATLSRDPRNLRNLHCKKYSSTNSKVLSVALSGANGLAVTLNKSTKVGTNPSAVAAVTLSKSGPRKLLRSVKSITANYRSDVTSAALARASRIFESQKPVKAVRARKPRGKKAAAAAK
ncbi:hypothetical protein HK405_008593 [Cladochytrium tenue]|nr:hypothetical protein HK405_008593 [Cladochytrium tenue]